MRSSGSLSVSVIHKRLGVLEQTVHTLDLEATPGEVGDPRRTRFLLHRAPPLEPPTRRPLQDSARSAGRALEMVTLSDPVKN